MEIVPSDPSHPNTVERLADEWAEAAAAARHAGQQTLARDLDDRVEVLRWAQSEPEASGLATH